MKSVNHYFSKNVGESLDISLIFTCSDGKTIAPGPDDIIETYDYCHCNSTKTVTGMWYGEITHVSGDNGYYFGFESFCGVVQLYTESAFSNFLKIYTEGCFSASGKDERINLTDRFSNNQVIGVRLNSKQKTFTVFHNNTFYTHSFYVSTSKQLRYSFRFGGGILQHAKDKIKVNFGTKPFKYAIPSLAFINETCRLSCNIMFHLSFSILFPYIYI